MGPTDDLHPSFGVTTLLNRRRISANPGARRPLIFGMVSALIAAPLVALGGGAAIELVEDNGRGPIDALIDKSTEMIATLREYRSALITNAVTGKIDVREAV